MQTQDQVNREIVERQRMLDRERADLEARLASRRQARPAAAPASDERLREIAEQLVALREELKSDIADGLTREVAGLRGEMASLKNSAGQALPPAMRQELVRLAECIERLGERGPDAGNAGLVREVEGFRAMLGEMSDDSAENWKAMHRRLGDFDPQTVRGEIAAMVARVEDIQSAIAGMAESAADSGVEARLKAVATSLATLAEQSSLDEAAIEHRFSELGERLDEISHAVVSVGSRSDRTEDAETLARIEQRVEALVRQMDNTGELEALEGLTTRLSMLTQNINSLASEESVAGLGARLDQLSTMLETGRSVQGDGDLADRLMEISAKIDTLGEGAVNDGLARRLDDLAARIDDVAVGIGSANQELIDRVETLVARTEKQAAAIPAASFESLDERLADIARRLDETRASPADTEILQNLESQLANLSDLISQPAAADLGGGVFANRLSVVEEHLETNDEYIIEAARQAAEAVVAAYARQPAGEGLRADEIAVISELAEDLRALEKLSQQSDERTARAFDAVHDTLVKIADHLENLGNANGVAVAPAVARQPVGESVYESFSDIHEDDRPVPAFGQRVEAVSDPHSRDEDEDAAEATHAFLSRAADDDELAADEIFADVVSVSEDQNPAKKSKAGARRGLLSGIGRRLRKGQDDAPAPRDGETTPERADLDDAPSLDPSDALEQDESDLSDAISSNEPLEPGTGAPDLDRIFRKVRAAQGDATGDNSDFIAAARRAAQAAAAEVETTEAGGSARSGGLKGMLRARRRPILLAVGAVLLVVMSWPLANALLNRPDASVAQNAPAEQTADAAPARVSNEKTGATAATDAEGPALPKVRAIDEGASSMPAAGDAGADQAQMTPMAPARPSASEPGTDPDAVASQPPAQFEAQAGSPTVQAAQPSADAADGGKPANLDASAQPQAAAPAMQASAPAPAAETASAKASAGEQPASAAAIPAIPDAIGPESLKLAARDGDGKALFEIGSRFTDGRGVDIDLKQAAQWYRAAAERGLAPAEYRLANFYEKGQGVERDIDTALEWYKKAAGQGNVSAMHNLAVLYAMGRDGTPDYSEAAGWFRKAADHGVKDSQYNLAILYAQGHGVPRDLAKSYKWFALAASDGDSDSVRKRDQVAAALSKDELARARASVSDWKAEPADPAANTVEIPPAWSGKDSRTASVDMSKAIRNIQVILDNNGFDAGKPDGVMGEKTRSAIRAFQKSVDQKPTGEITDDLIKELLALNKKQQKES